MAEFKMADFKMAAMCELIDLRMSLSLGAEFECSLLSSLWVREQTFSKISHINVTRLQSDFMNLGHA